MRLSPSSYRVSACSRDKRYQFEGQVLAVDPARRRSPSSTSDIGGFMPGMTMPFKVRDGRSLQGRKPGDLISATLVVTNSTGRLEDIVNTGEAPLTADAAHGVAGASLEPGASVADAAFVDQVGPRRGGCRTGAARRWPSRSYTRAVRCPTSARSWTAISPQFSKPSSRTGSSRPHPPPVDEFRPGLRHAGGAGGACENARAPDPMRGRG